MPLASRFTDLLTAWSTFAAAIFGAAATAVAVFAVVAAVRAYRTQAEQLKLQQQQIADQQDLNRRQGEVLELQAQELRDSIVDRRRVASDDRRRLAIQVFYTLYDVSGAGEIHWSASIRNTGSLPVYDVHVRWFTNGVEFFVGEDFLPELDPPGRLLPEMGGNWEVTHPGRLDEPHAITAWVEFRDANEVWWRIKPDGRIEEIGPPASS